MWKKSQFGGHKTKCTSHITLEYQLARRIIWKNYHQKESQIWKEEVSGKRQFCFLGTTVIELSDEEDRTMGKFKLRRCSWFVYKAPWSFIDPTLSYTDRLHKSRLNLIIFVFSKKKVHPSNTQCAFALQLKSIESALPNLLVANVRLCSGVRSCFIMLALIDYDNCIDGSISVQWSWQCDAYNMRTNKRTKDKRQTIAHTQFKQTQTKTYSSSIEWNEWN